MVSIETPDDPFELTEQSQPAALLSMINALIGVSALGLYSIWLLRIISGNFAGYMEAETVALSNLTAVITGAAGPAIFGSVGAAIGVVAICVASAVYQWKIEKVWRRKVKREWRWVVKHVTSGSALDVFLGVLGAVLTFVETVYYVVITVVTPIIVIANVVVLVKVVL